LRIISAEILKRMKAVPISYKKIKIRMDMILLDQLEIQGIHMSTEIVVEERIGL